MYLFLGFVSVPLFLPSLCISFCWYVHIASSPDDELPVGPYVATTVVTFPFLPTMSISTHLPHLSHLTLFDAYLAIIGCSPMVTPPTCLFRAVACAHFTFPLPMPPPVHAFSISYSRLDMFPAVRLWSIKITTSVFVHARFANRALLCIPSLDPQPFMFNCTTPPFTLFQFMCPPFL